MERFDLERDGHTWCFPIVLPTSSVNLLKIFLLSSLAIFDHSPLKKLEFDVGSSSKYTGSSLNVSEKSDSKNDSKISSAKTTIRNLKTRN